MSKLTLAVVACFSAVLMGGCMDARIGKVDPFATPAYSGRERGELIARNIEMEWKMMNDDIDDVLLLRPVSQLSVWHVR